MPPRKPKPIEDFNQFYAEYLLEPQSYEQLNVVYASTVTSISEIPRIVSLWGNTEEGMRHPEQIEEAETLFTRFTELLGPYFFQYREFPVIEYLIDKFLQDGELPQRDFFREYMPDKSEDDRLELIRLLDKMFRNTLGSYRGSLLHFLDVVVPVMIDSEEFDATGLLQHVPTYSPFQRQTFTELMQHDPFTEAGRFFLVDDETADNFTAAQAGFMGELLNNGKLEEYEDRLLNGLYMNPAINLTPETATRILHMWLVYMITCEFPEGILINANNASKIFYCDRIIDDGINLIRNWFTICQNGLPRVIRERSLKEADIYIKIKWRLEDLEVQAGIRDPLPAATFDPLNDFGHESEFDQFTGAPLEKVKEKKEVHCMFRTREDQMVPNDKGGYDIFDRKTGVPEESDTIASDIADTVTLIAGQLLAYSGYADKPKGKMMYIEIYADEIPELTSRLVHLGIELDEQGKGFQRVDRSITPDQVPERMRLLSLFVYNLVAHKGNLKEPLARQKLSLAPNPRSRMDKKPPKSSTPVKRKKKKKGEPPQPKSPKPMVQPKLF